MENVFPPGWDEERVRALIAYHESQMEDQVAEEVEADPGRKGETLMSIPHGLLSVVLDLLEHYEQAQTTALKETTEPITTPFAVTLPAVVEDGQVKLGTSATLAEGTNLLVTALSYDPGAIDVPRGPSALDAIWENDEDDVYAELLRV
ncbi:MAG: hypothetical protein DYG89_05905 [Caldilinea sp. CFX5]|nr:hypothetical protein [Caldilinea sp. CFX5]